MNLIEDDFKCPISKFYFNKPVKTSDGKFYEKQQIKLWFKENSISPMTGLEIDTTLTVDEEFNIQLKKFYEQNPHLEKEKYVKDLSLTCYTTYIDDARYHKLYQYPEFHFYKLIDNSTLQKLMSEIPEEILEYYINRCVDLDKCYVDSRNKPIHTACKYQYVNLVKHLIRLNVDLEYENNGHERPIHLSLRYFNKEIVMALLEKNISLKSQDEGGNTPLMLACRYADVEVISKMIEMGAKINDVNLDELHTLRMICANQDYSVFQYLYNLLPKISFKNILTIAATDSNFNLQILEFLLKKKVDLNQILDKNNNRCVNLASKHMNKKVIEFLLDKVNINVPNNSGETPLHIICKNKYSTFEMISLFLSKNADYKLLDHKDKIAFYYLSEYNPTIISKLFDFVDSEQLFFNNKKIIHFACQYLDVKAVKKLIEKKVDLNSMDNARDTPLHILFRHLPYLYKSTNKNNPESILEIARLIIKENIDVNKKNDNEISPMDMILKDHDHFTQIHFELLKLLIDAGANMKKVHYSN